MGCEVLALSFNINVKKNKIGIIRVQIVFITNSELFYAKTTFLKYRLSYNKHCSLVG